MRMRNLICAGLAVTLAAAIASAAPASAHSPSGQPYWGGGMMGLFGYGPGMMQGYRQGTAPYHGPQAMGRYSYDGARQACAARFRSFEWNTGLYTTYSGKKRLCPYLR